MKNHQWRVFFAVPLETEQREKLNQSLLHSEVQLPSRIIDPSSWHIALFFIGSIKHSEVDILIERVRSKTWTERFEIVLDLLGAYPNPEEAKLLWYGIGQGKARLQEIGAEISKF